MRQQSCLNLTPFSLIMVENAAKKKQFIWSSLVPLNGRKCCKNEAIRMKFIGTII